MEVKQAQTGPTEQTAKHEHVKTEVLKALSFAQLVENVSETGRLTEPATDHDVDCGDGPDDPDDPEEKQPALGDEIACNYWQLLRLSAASGDQSEEDEEEDPSDDEDENPDQSERKRSRKRE